jgi:uncharacterized membrane protein
MAVQSAIQCVDEQRAYANFSRMNPSACNDRAPRPSVGHTTHGTLTNAQMIMTRRVTIVCMALLAALSLLWELWLAPLRPEGSMLAHKALPLLAALPALVRGHLKAYQWWSLLLMGYLMEGLVRMASDTGPSAVLAGIETGLAVIAFVGVLAYTYAHKRPRTNGAGQPSPEHL